MRHQLWYVALWSTCALSGLFGGSWAVLDAKLAASAAWIEPGLLHLITALLVVGVGMFLVAKANP